MKTACSAHRLPCLRAPLYSSGLLAALAAASLLALSPKPAHASDIAAAASPAEGLKWQARLELGNPDADKAFSGSPSRLLSAQLMGDYFLTGSGLGGVQGGLRATGGMLLGPRSMSQHGLGASLGANAARLGPNWSISQRSLSGNSPGLDAGDPTTAMSYLGLGYTGQSLRGGWGFSADLGLLGNSSSLRLGNSRGPGMDELLRDLRFQPVLQLGLSYSY